MKFKTIFYTLLFLLFTTSLFAAQRTLSWEPNRESHLAGYKVHYGLISKDAGGFTEYDIVKDVGNVTNYIVTGLIEGDTYFFAATAYDGTGNESGYSNEVSYTVPYPPLAPPTGLKLSGVNELTWEHDQKDIDGHYRVYVKSNLRAEAYIRTTTDKFIYISGVNKEKQRLAVSWIINEPMVESGISNIFCVRYRGWKAKKTAC